MKLSSGWPLIRKEAGKTVKWQHSKAKLRVPELRMSYIERELVEAAETERKMEDGNGGSKKK